jgi:5-methylcytosine-specific restriction endonuclease McrA
MISHADCQKCGAHFHYERAPGPGAARKYCEKHAPSSREWRLNGGKHRAGRHCVECEADISGLHGRAIFCSKECKKSHTNARKKQANASKPARVVSSTCKECGSEFSYAKTWSGKDREVCSDDCKGIIYHRLQAKLKADRDRKRQKEAFKRFDKKARNIKARADSRRRECSCCGVLFVPNYQGVLKGARGTMCGKACSIKAATEAAQVRMAGVKKGDPNYPEARLARNNLQLEITAIRRIASRKGFIRRVTECQYCHKSFMPNRAYQIYCSAECTQVATLEALSLRRWEEQVKGKVKECMCCGVQYCMTYKAKRMSFCSSGCRKKYYRDKPKDRGDKRAHRERRERRKAAGRTGNVSPVKICERDNWQCQGCGIDTPQELRGTYEPNAPELDHVVPLALEGAHGPENIQLLCRACNLDKGDKHPDEWVPSLLLSNASKNNGLGGRV